MRAFLWGTGRAFNGCGLECSCANASLTICLAPSLWVCQAVGSDGVRAMMESALTARDRVGVQDFVLLENHTSEVAFIDNLRKRFKENLIYVRITSVFPNKCQRLGAFCFAVAHHSLFLF